MAAREHDDKNRQDKSYDKHCEKYADCQEKLLPKLGHPAENFAIYNSVIKAESNFKYDEDGI